LLRLSSIFLLFFFRKGGKQLFLAHFLCSFQMVYCIFNCDDQPVQPFHPLTQGRIVRLESFHYIKVWTLQNRLGIGQAQVKFPVE
jgi:hypothetical protein